MSTIKIQEYAMAAFKVAKVAHVDAGKKMSVRVDNTRKYWINFAMDKKGYSLEAATVMIKDAEDMADLEMNAI
jgi:hypothetical protein